MKDAKVFSGGFFVPRFGHATGRTAIRASDANDLVDLLNILGNMKVARGNTNEFIYSDGNIVLTLKNISDSSSSSSSVGLPVRANITAIHNDYVEVQLWDGAAFSGSAVNVARPYELRASLASDTIYGVGVTYSASDENTRTATSGGFDTETHKVIPPYEINRELLVVDTGVATGVTGCTYIDLNIGGRTWASVPAIPIP